nr:hypothetical chloroplast RF19 [Ipomoea batatas]
MYDPFLNGPYRGKIKKELPPSIIKNTLIADSRETGEQNRLHDLLLPNSNYENFDQNTNTLEICDILEIDAFSSILIHKIGKNVPRWSYKLISELEQLSFHYSPPAEHEIRSRRAVGEYLLFDPPETHTTTKATDKETKTNASKETDTVNKETKPNASKETDTIDKETKPNASKETDTIDKETKPNASKETDTIDKETKTNASKENNTVDKETKTNASKETDTVDKETKTNASKETDTVDKETKTNASKETDTVDKETKTNASKETDTVNKETKPNASKETDTVNKETKTKTPEEEAKEDEEKGLVLMRYAHQPDFKHGLIKGSMRTQRRKIGNRTAFWLSPKNTFLF